MTTAMLPAHARLRRSRDFTAVLHRGAGNVRVGRPLLVAHVSVNRTGAAAADESARAGFVVSRAVGGAVVRNRVRRRLRALAAARLHRLPPGSRLVVRATPRAASADSQALGRELDAALDAALSAVARGGRSGQEAGPLS